MGEQIPVTQARAELAELVNRVAYAGERIELTRHGKLVAALVSAADYQRLQNPGPVRTVASPPQPTLVRRRHCRSRPRPGPRWHQPTRASIPRHSRPRWLRGPSTSPASGILLQRPHRPVG